MASLATLGAVCLTAFSTLPMEAWWLQAEGRDAFTKQHTASLVSVSYARGRGELLDAGLTPRLMVSGVVTADRKGSKVVYAPYAPLAEAGEIRVHFRDGTIAPAALVAPEAPTAAALVALRVSADALAPWPGLQWAAVDGALAGRRAWLLEPSPGLIMGGPPHHVLVDTFVGNPAEAPLSHLHYVDLARAVGLPLLDERGQILCMVFRTSDLHEGRSLCIPGQKGAAPKQEVRPLVIEP